jgi:hypothetical protein
MREYCEGGDTVAIEGTEDEFAIVVVRQEAHRRELAREAHSGRLIEYYRVYSNVDWMVIMVKVRKMPLAMPIAQS